MSEFEAEVKKAEKELEQGLVPVNSFESENSGAGQDEFLGDFKMQAQEYGQKIQDAAAKAKDFAGENSRRPAISSRNSRTRTRRSSSRTRRNLRGKNRVRRS